MCGVFGYIGHQQKAADIVFNGLKTLEYRGYDSWGIATVLQKQNSIYVQKHVGKIAESHVNHFLSSSLALGHTRWATHGGVTQKNAHPHLDCSGSIAIVHNGIFENFYAQKQLLLHKGHTFVSETDSEVIAHTIEEHMKTLSFQQAVHATFHAMRGCNALVAIHAEEHMIVAARRGSPLVIGIGTHETIIASDPTALLPHTTQAYFLEDGQYAVLTDQGVHVYEIAHRKEVSLSLHTLTQEKENQTQHRYPHLMIKEIMEQPKVLKRIVQHAKARAYTISHIMKKSHSLYIVGCGTSFYESLIGKHLMSTLWHKSIHAVVGSEFLYEYPFIQPKNTHILALSQSGETMDILDPIKHAQSLGAHITACVNVVGSSLDRLADERIYVDAGSEKAVASTKAASAKIAHLILLTYTGIHKLKKGQAYIEQAIHSINKVLSSNGRMRIRKLATFLKHTQHIFVIGRGVSYPVALESALKIKEVSYIHAEGLVGGELKHGTLALIEQGTPVIVFLPKDETCEKTLHSIQEMKARGAHIIGVSEKNHHAFDTYIHVQDAGVATTLPHICVAQLLAYELALCKNLDPDKPRNLAKSVTVQ